jgi:hypothetical protein
MIVRCVVARCVVTRRMIVVMVVIGQRSAPC